jgi:hypothetical protein
MPQPDNLPAFCRVHRNGRPLMHECASCRGVTERQAARLTDDPGCVTREREGFCGDAASKRYRQPSRADGATSIASRS